MQSFLKLEKVLVSEFLRVSLKEFETVGERFNVQKKIVFAGYLTFPFFSECHIVRNVMEAIKK